jgi:hypothetical protein
LIPPLGGRRKSPASGLRLHQIKHLAELVERFGQEGRS